MIIDQSSKVKRIPENVVFNLDIQSLSDKRKINLQTRRNKESFGTEELKLKWVALEIKASPLSMINLCGIISSCNSNKT